MSTLQVPRADVLDVDADAPPAGFGLPTGDVRCGPVATADPIGYVQNTDRMSVVRMGGEPIMTSPRQQGHRTGNGSASYRGGATRCTWAVVTSDGGSPQPRLSGHTRCSWDVTSDESVRAAAELVGRI